MTQEVVWGGRFAAPPDPMMLELTGSLSVDIRLLPHDLRTTCAHAAALVRADLLEPDDAEAIMEACDDILRAWQEGTLPMGSHEDVHSLVEHELTARLGDVGRRIHAGRSRNDLVATDLRLWCKEQGTRLAEASLGLVQTLTDVAGEHTETVMPGYTHLQRAQPITLGFHLCAHAFGIERDVNRFHSSVDAADRSVLGAGAIAGTTLPIEPHATARDLGFGATFENAMDGVSDRDFVSELLHACALCAVHLSRLAEEIVLWTTSEFGFARLADEWSTGSSMMPQKRNPDLAELIRGRSSGAISDLTGFLTLVKGLPLAYNRDMQEDKTYVFRSVERTLGCLVGMRSLISGLSFQTEAMLAATSTGGLLATDLAEQLVTEGVPFRVAHEQTGEMLRKGKTEPDAADDVVAAVNRRSGRGGAAPKEVARQIEVLRRSVTAGSDEAHLYEAPSHLLSLADLQPDHISFLLDSAALMRSDLQLWDSALKGKTVALLFEKPSTRTRVSFEVAATQLGGHPSLLRPEELQSARGETIEDTARTLSGYVDGIAMRTFAHERLTSLAAAASVPVLNALTDQEHPCQALADLLTIKDHFGAFEDVTLAFIGPANNVTNSLILAAASVGMRLVVGCPGGSGPSEAILSEAARISDTKIEVVHDAPSAVLGADVVYADTWVSMGDGCPPEEAAQRCAPFQVNEALMAQATERAIFMHCLPAHRGSEVTSEVLDGPRSVVWEQAENRLHVQKALLRWMLLPAT